MERIREVSRNINSLLPAPSNRSLEKVDWARGATPNPNMKMPGVCAGFLKTDPF